MPFQYTHVSNSRKLLASCVVCCVGNLPGYSEATYLFSPRYESHPDFYLKMKIIIIKSMNRFSMNTAFVLEDVCSSGLKLEFILCGGYLYGDHSLIGTDHGPGCSRAALRR